MKGETTRFYAALGVYLLWLGALTLVAFQSSERPRELPAAVAPAR